MVQNVQYFQLGCKLLDLIVGGDKGVYGVPGGRIWNLCGDKGSGKTYLCNEAIAWAHYILGNKFKWMYADCEHGVGQHPHFPITEGQRHFVRCRQES